MFETTLFTIIILFIASVGLLLIDLWYGGN